METSTPKVSRFWSSSFSALAFCRCSSVICCTSAFWFAVRRFSCILRPNSRCCAFCTPRSSFATSAARSLLPAAALATSILCRWMPSKIACASVISGVAIMSPMILPASSIFASSYSASSANRLIVAGLMASCRFISTFSHSVLSMLIAPSTPACCAAAFHNAFAPSLVPSTARLSLITLSYCCAGLPSRTLSACRKVTPCLRASATASLQLPYAFTSSAFACPLLFTVYSSLCSSGYSSHSSLLR